MPVVTVPQDVYDFIEQMRVDRPEIVTSIRKMSIEAKEQKLKDVAQWINNNPVAYGFGWAFGFQVDKPEPSQAEESAVEDQPPPSRRRRPKALVSEQSEEEQTDE